MRKGLDAGNKAPPAKLSFPCSHCPYRTDRKNNLSRHLATMHTMTRTKVKCCDVYFYSKWDLKNHNRTVHRNGYVCALCDRVFQRKDLRDRHFSVHTGERKFKCNTCTYSSSHRSNLDRHGRVHRERGCCLTELPPVMAVTRLRGPAIGRIFHSIQSFPCPRYSYSWIPQEKFLPDQSGRCKVFLHSFPLQDQPNSPPPAKHAWCCGDPLAERNTALCEFGSQKFGASRGKSSCKI